MGLEEFLNNINANRFLREFSFSKNEFNPKPGEEIEFADHIILLDDLLTIYQLKERGESTNHTLESEKKWFENKVLKKSKKQIKDTLKYFNENDHIEIINQRGHKFDIKSKTINVIIKIILYAPSSKLPLECYNTKYYQSEIAGFIHILPIHDYLNICNTFITPCEIAQYFDFREGILTHYPSWTDERAIAGQFLYGAFDEAPDMKYIEYLEKLENDVRDFDIFPILKEYKESIAYSIGHVDDTDYYSILEEFAKLNRMELREVKTRIIKCIEECKTKKFTKPYRMLSIRTGCGFVFISLEEGLKDQRITGLKNFTYASKYLFQIPRNIGVSFVKVGATFLIDWCYMEFEWRHDPGLEKQLKDNFPFRNVSLKSREYYKFRENNI